MYQHDESNEPTNEGPLSFDLFESPFTSVSTSVVDPDPDPHGSESFSNLYPHVDPHPHQIKNHNPDLHSDPQQGDRSDPDPFQSDAV